MDGCIFCKIANGEAPSYKIMEDDIYMAFLDIFPRVPGHVLVIPKKHTQWVYDVDDFGDYWKFVLKVTKALQKSLKPDYVNYVTYGAIKHAHIHVLPRTGKPIGGENDNVEMVPPVIKPQMTSTELQRITDKIKESSNI